MQEITFKRVMKAEKNLQHFNINHFHAFVEGGLFFSYKNKIVWIDTDTQKNIKTIELTDYTSSIASNQIDKVFIAQFSAPPLLVDTETKSVVPMQQRRTVSVGKSVFLDDQKAVSCDFNGTLTSWNLATGKVVRTFNDSSFYFLSLAFDSVNKRILAGGSGSSPEKIIIFDPETLNITSSITMNHGSVWSIVVIDENFFAVGTNKGRVVFFDSQKKKEISSFSWHHPSTSVFGLSVSPDRKLIASTSQDRTTKVHDIQTKRLVFEAFRESWGRAVSFSPDGLFLAVSIEFFGTDLYRITPSLPFPIKSAWIGVTRSGKKKFELFSDASLFYDGKPFPRAQIASPFRYKNDKRDWEEALLAARENANKTPAQKGRSAKKIINRHRLSVFQTCLHMKKKSTKTFRWPKDISQIVASFLEK